MDLNSDVVLRSFRLGLADDRCNYSTQSKPEIKKAEPQEERLNSVEVLDVRHGYDDNERVLRGLNMNVPYGSIYGLLGASGCGKTTLLKIIIGLIKPDSGFVDVLGQIPGTPGSGIPGTRVGYMPQDVALYSDLTIHEILVYFGRLYFMERRQIEKQIDYLMAILDLPGKERLISTLSGGQMRRVSFAAALIHEPPLVILDEPTAGVDPILRDNIWKHLRNICMRLRITVIITTHYIEEARGAETVGLMRKGQLLAEESPSTLLERYNLATLEDVFLELCVARKVTKGMRQESVIDSTPSENNVPTDLQCIVARKQRLQQVQARLNRRPRLKRLHTWATTWYSMFMTLLWKNFVRSIRHPPLIVFQYILPLVQIVLFCICIGGDPFDIPVGIVNDEDPPNLSALFINSLDPYFILQKNFSTLAEALEETRANRLWGVLHIRQNFSEALIARLDIHGEPSNDTIQQSKIILYPDLTDKILGVSIERSLDASYQDFLGEVLREYDRDPGLVALPLALGEPVYGSFQHKQHKGFREYMAPGILTSATFAMAYALTTVVLVLEREEKTFERNFVTGVTPSQIIIAHTLNRLAFMVLQVVILLGVTVYVFDIPSRGPLLCAMLLLLAQNIAGVAYGMLISALCRKTITATMIAIGTLFFIIIVSGVFWPVESMPLWIQWFSLAQPSTIPIESLRSILSRGWGWTHYGVLKGFAVTFAWIFALFAVGIATFRYD